MLRFLFPARARLTVRLARLLLTQAPYQPRRDIANRNLNSLAGQNSGSLRGAMSL